MIHCANKQLETLGPLDILKCNHYAITMEINILLLLQLHLVLLICDTSILSSFPLVCMLFLSYLFTYTYLHMKWSVMYFNVFGVQIN